VNGCSCLVCLIDTHTAESKWVEYEIKKAWNDKKSILGIYIHNLKCPHKGIGNEGNNPFDCLYLKNGEKLSAYVKTFNPKSDDAYNDISNNLERLIEYAMANK
jgi:hypothetical protein